MCSGCFLFSQPNSFERNLSSSFDEVGVSGLFFFSFLHSSLDKVHKTMHQTYIENDDNEKAFFNRFRSSCSVLSQSGPFFNQINIFLGFERKWKPIGLFIPPPPPPHPPGSGGSLVPQRFSANSFEGITQCLREPKSLTSPSPVCTST